MIGDRFEDLAREGSEIRPYRYLCRKLADASYFEPVVVDREGDLENALPSLCASQVRGQLVDRDLEILDVVDGELQARRESGGDEPHHLDILREGRNSD